MDKVHMTQNQFRDGMLIIIAGLLLWGDIETVEQDRLTLVTIFMFILWAAYLQMVSRAIKQIEKNDA